jgi:hypothetical protein
MKNKSIKRMHPCILFQWHEKQGMHVLGAWQTEMISFRQGERVYEAMN